MALMTRFVFLASQSPRRRQLLDQIGVPHQLLLPSPALDPDEDLESLEAVLRGELPRLYVERVTRLKLAAAIARRNRRLLSSQWSDAAGAAAAPVICADTTVALNDVMLGKPVDTADAARMLTLLSGQRHRVLTCVAVASAQGGMDSLISESWVTFETMDAGTIERYIGTQEPFGKAGGYGVQGMAAAFISRMEGSYSGIMGLPLYETAQLLRRQGWEL
jgi:septum formation protein